MRSKMTPLLVLLLTGVLLTQTTFSHATCLTGGEPVVAKPTSAGGSAQFTVQAPTAPALAGGYHWMLVGDFYPSWSTGQALNTGYYSMPSATAKQELYNVSNANQEDAGMVFNACTIRSQLLPNGPLPVTVNLVVKQGATQSDGNPIVLTSTVGTVYERSMPLNPITNQAWTSADLFFGTIIGVKAAANTNAGVGLESIILECQ
jgi:hypothetical protein